MIGVSRLSDDDDGEKDGLKQRVADPFRYLTLFQYCHFQILTLGPERAFIYCMNSHSLLNIIASPFLSEQVAHCRDDSGLFTIGLVR